MSKFYNPGFKWEELLKYDNPVSDAREVNNISYYRLRAPERGFFEVDDTMTMTIGSGDEITVPLHFRKLVQSQYADRGVMLVVNGDEQAARKAGDAQWKTYMREKANEWFRIVGETKAAGRIPTPAQGLFKRILEELHIEDPADTADVITRAKEGQQTNSEMVALIQELRDKVNRLEGAQSARKTA